MDKSKELMLENIIDALLHPNDYSLDVNILEKIEHDLRAMSQDKVTVDRYNYKINFARSLLFYHKSDDDNAIKFAKKAISEADGNYPEAERFLQNIQFKEIDIENLTILPIGSPFKYIKHSLWNFGNINGRARRAEYWYWVLFWLIGYFLCVVVDFTLNPQTTESDQSVGIFTSIYSLATLVPYITVTVRRLHDTGRSGWYYFIGIIPVVGWLSLLYFILDFDESYENKYGVNPIYTDIYS